MAKTIQQSVVLGATAKALFETYIDSKKHGALTGAPATVSRRPGSRFSAFGGGLVGRMLHVVPGRLIVQAWRGGQWPAGDPDSILILGFSDTSKGGRIDMVHANVPDHDAKMVAEGWHSYYWKPWKAALAKAGRRSRRETGDRR